MSLRHEPDDTPPTEIARRIAVIRKFNPSLFDGEDEGSEPKHITSDSDRIRNALRIIKINRGACTLDDHVELRQILDEIAGELTK